MALLGPWTRITIDIATKVGPRLQHWRNTEAVGWTTRLACRVAITMRLSWSAARYGRCSEAPRWEVGVVVSRPEFSPSAWSLGREGSRPSTCPTRIRLGP